MPKLPQIDPATATGPAAVLLDEVQKSLGLVPNMTKVMANSPALLTGYLKLSGALATGVIPAGAREQLEKDIRNWITAWNKDPKPFIWTKTADQILESLGRLIKRTNGEGH